MLWRNLMKTSMHPRFIFGLLAFCNFLPAQAEALIKPALPVVTVQDKEGPTVQVLLDGKVFTEYWYQDVPRPFLYPVIGPNGEGVTRSFPMKDSVADEPQDHIHHRSLWFAHERMNGVDFWSEAVGKHGKQVHARFGFVGVKDGQAVIESENNWAGPDGKLILTDSRRVRVIPLAAGQTAIDFTIVLKPEKEDLLIGEAKDGLCAMRVNAAMALKDQAKEKQGVSQGHILMSTGKKDAEAWGTRAAWCNYFGPDAGGKPAGIVMMDHPGNLRHPTWWHARDYGLCSANPFGQGAFEKAFEGKKAGDHTVKLGTTLKLRYRYVVHNGQLQAPEIEALYQQFGKDS